MPAHLRILDTDGSVDAALLGDAVPWATTTIVDLRDLAPALRRWSRRRTIELARARLAAAPDLRPVVTFLGADDFQHLSALLVARVAARFSVLHLGNRAGWTRLPPRWHRDAWINRVLALPQVARVVTVGVCSSDLDDPWRRGGNLPALDSGRLALFPWQHASSRARWRVANGPGHEWHEGYLHWRNLAERQVEDAVALVVDAIPTETVWITLDKDVLAGPEARATRGQGQMPLAALLDLLAAIGRTRRILGMDVCGKYSSSGCGNPRPDGPADGATEPLGIADNRQIDLTLARAFYLACASHHP